MKNLWSSALVRSQYFLMKKAKRGITILSFGDKLDYDEYNKLNREKILFIRNGFDYATVNYKDVLKGRFPKIETSRLIIFLFFPFNYWNKNIEHKYYRGIYGSRIFYHKFMHFWSKVNAAINEHFSDKELLIINNPLLSGKYRNKQLIKFKLSSARIPVPNSYCASNNKDIHNLLSKGVSLFLKPSYGSMGKGITYLSQGNWQTNFNFKDNKIISRRSDRGWKFRDVTGNNAFLGKLIKKDIMIEEAIEPPVLRKRKIDLRLYVFFRRVIYIYPKTNHPEKVTTNISQGGRGAPHILKLLPKQLIDKAKKAAINAAQVLNLDLVGVDVIFNHNLKDVYIVDVNIFPGYPKRRTFNLARVMIKELARLDNQRILKNLFKPISGHSK